jgi:hypothetical protein
MNGDIVVPSDKYQKPKARLLYIQSQHRESYTINASIIQSHPIRRDTHEMATDNEDSSHSNWSGSRGRTQSKKRKRKGMSSESLYEESPRPKAKHPRSSPPTVNSEDPTAQGGNPQEQGESSSLPIRSKNEGRRRIRSPTCLTSRTQVDSERAVPNPIELEFDQDDIPDQRENFSETSFMMSFGAFTTSKSFDKTGPSMISMHY